MRRPAFNVPRETCYAARPLCLYCDNAMARLLFKLAQVPDDEVDEIRALLHENTIAFYETDVGFWRVGLDAIWLPDGGQELQARELIRQYQQQRLAQQRSIHAQLAEQGDIPSLWQRVKAHPLRMLGLVLAISFVLALTLLPFVMLMYRPLH